MSQILKYRRHSFEYKNQNNILEGIISNNEKNLEITSLNFNQSQTNIEIFIQETLTLLLRIYWREFHIKINQILLQTKEEKKEKKISLNMDNEHTPIHNRKYTIHI